jgi:hypothetical protein
MSGVVQHKSVQATTQSVSITLDNAVTQGNLLIAVIGCASGNSISSLNDGGDTFNMEIGFGVTPVFGYVYDAVIGTAGTLTLTVNFGSSDGLGKHIHLYEVNGYVTFDKLGGQTQTNTTSPSASITYNTSEADELVLAGFIDETYIDITFTPGSGYTAGETTNTDTFSMFTEFKTISSVGEPTATCTVSASSTVSSFIGTWYGTGGSGGSGGSGGGAGTSTTFLGSVTEVDSAPAGENDPFLGTVTVVSSAPAGLPNPYLGRVRVGSPSGQQNNPALGEVVVVSSAPAGLPNPYLGTVSTS